MGDLTGRQTERLARALEAAFDQASMTRLVAFKFQPPEGIPTPIPPIGPFGGFTEGLWPNRVLMLIEKAEREGWTEALVREAHQFQPGNYKLREVHDEYFSSVQRQVRGEQALQRLVSETNSYLQPAVWRERLAALEPTVCAIELAGHHVGTGFLVGRDIVLTNQHVMKKAIAAPALAKQVTFRFDYRRFGNNVLNAGKEHRAHETWLLASSGASAADTVVDPASLRRERRGAPKTEEPGPDELDYCFVRLAAEASADRVRDAARGFVAAPPWSTERLAEATALHILQHPLGRPLELCLGVEAVVRTNAGRNRVRYRTNTEPGSSGSPCFDGDWALTALHHSGDPDFSRSADYNEGIPIEAIRAHMPEALRHELQW